MKSAPENRRIVEDYIATLKELSDYRTTAYLYPALVYPVSLLPWPKEQIMCALEEIKEEAFLSHDYELVRLVDWAKAYLDAFIADGDAYYQNWLKIVGQSK